MKETVNITNYVNKEYKEYSKYVLYSRAIPHVIDGLKPSQRKIVYTASKVCKDKRIKTASLSGSIISLSNFHHGDASLNEAINKMVQPFNNNLPLLNGEGSFGSRLVPEAAAARYTFVKISPNFDKYFIDREIMQPQPDPEDPEPRFYLPTIPWVLVNGISGIAVGFATDIPPRNPKQLKKVCADYINGKNIDNVEIPPYYEGFEGTIKKNVDGKWESVGVYEKNGTKLLISEVPINYTREQYVSILDKLISDGKIVGYKDKCNKTGFNFEITLRRGSKFTDKQIVSTFKLSSKIKENLTTIDESGAVKVFDSVNDIVKHFCDYRLSRYPLRYEYYIKRDSAERDERQEIVDFVEQVVSGGISIEDKNKKELVSLLKNEGYKHYEKLVNLPIYRMCKDEIAAQKKKISDLDKAIETWQNVNYKKAYLEDLK